MAKVTKIIIRNHCSLILMISVVKENGKIIQYHGHNFIFEITEHKFILNHFTINVKNNVEQITIKITSRISRNDKLSQFSFQLCCYNLCLIMLCLHMYVHKLMY